ncbi:hypothetical protein B566_EDAN009692 [Ephemera danica]|nr:hypothetical protein B566_EDAN009692 [Ephemera danica]
MSLIGLQIRVQLMLVLKCKGKNILNYSIVSYCTILSRHNLIFLNQDDSNIGYKVSKNRYKINSNLSLSPPVV